MNLRRLRVINLNISAVVSLQHLCIIVKFNFYVIVLFNTIQIFRAYPLLLFYLL